jgi:uncharacterized protein
MTCTGTETAKRIQWDYAQHFFFDGIEFMSTIINPPTQILTVSDVVIPFIYSISIKNKFKDIELVIGCGDLPYFYLEYILSSLNVPLFYVRGNHDKVIEYSGEAQRAAPAGGTDLHCRVVNYQGLLMAGVEGSLRYRPGHFQYSQSEMWVHVLSMVPALFMNHLRFGRYLDIFVTHAPPQGIHDMPDLPHQGIKAFRWLLKVFKPTYQFHGHIHLYRPDAVYQTLFEQTQIINSFGYQEIHWSNNNHHAT